MSVDYDLRVDERAVLETLAKLSFLLSSDGLTVFLASTIAPYLQQRAADRFRMEGDDVVGKWAPHAESTASFREEQGYAPTPINHRSGELENWVVGDNWRAYPRALGSTLVLPGKTPGGELGKKMKTAQMGSKLSPATPARPVIGLNERDLIFTMTALEFAIKKAIE